MTAFFDLQTDCGDLGGITALFPDFYSLFTRHERPLASHFTTRLLDSPGFCRLEAWMAIAILSLLARAFDAANAGAWVPVALVGLATVWLGRNAAFVHLQKG
jgi:hypothetical protein